MKVITISGQRGRDSVATLDFVSWRCLAALVGDVSCHWAGPPLDLREPHFRVSRRLRGGCVRDIVWFITTARAAAADARTAGDVIINGADPIGWALAFLIARIFGHRLVFDVHADFSRLPIASMAGVRASVLRLATIPFMRRADAVRVVSPTTLEDLRTQGIQAILIPSRLGPQWRLEENRERVPLADRNDIRLVAVGSLITVKGFGLLLDAFARLQAETRAARGALSLTIVGDGPLEIALKAKAASLHLLEDVRFAGFLSKEEVKQTLLNSDILVISSLSEGTPRVLLEGVAAGLPIVATAVGGITDIAADLPTVVLAAPTVDSLAVAMGTVLVERPQMDALAESRRLVFQRYEFAVNLLAVASYLQGGR